MNELQIAAQLDRAHLLIQEEKPLHAIQVYLRLIRNEPDLIPAYTELSSLYTEQGLIDAAVQLISRAEEQFPGNAEIIFLLGTLYMGAEQYDAALVSFKKLTDRKFPHVHFNMGVAYYYKNNIKLAEEQFRLTMKYDPAFPRINESLGELLLKRNALAEAIMYLKKSIVADPYSAINHHLLGLAFSKGYDWKKAYNQFVLAIEMDPNEPANWYLCGEMLMELKRLDESEQYVRKALELNSQSIDALIVLGQLMFRRGDMTRAQQYAKQALAIDPKNTRARELTWSVRGNHKQQQKQ